MSTTPTTKRIRVDTVRTIDIQVEEPLKLAGVRAGDRVTILIPNGIGRNGQEWKEATGRVVMPSSNGGFVLNMGGRYGTPGIADESNTVRVRKARR